MRHVCVFLLTLAPALASAGSLAGCSRDPGEAAAGAGSATPGGKGAIATSLGGAASPEAAFEQLKTGANAEDYRAFFNVLARESQNQMLVGLMLGAAITLAPVGTKPNPDKQKELEAIFARYGVQDDGAPVAPGPPAQMMEAMGKKLDAVKDRPGLFHDLMRFVEKNSLSERRSTVVALEGLKRLGDDKATGVAVMKYRDGKVEKRPIEFRKIDGRWYVYITKWR